MGKKLFVLLAVIVSLIAPRIYHLVWALGLHKSYYNHQPGSCRILAGIDYGSEDMEEMPDGNTIITSGLRLFGTYEKDPPPDLRGRVYSFNMSEPEADPVEVVIEKLADPDHFNPHGLSSWTDGSEVLVYIVSHYSDHSVVHSFKYIKNTLVFRKTFSDPSFLLMNDVVSVGRDQFYYTNFQYTRANPLEQLLGIPWGSVGFYDVTEGRIVTPGLVGANGIDISPDHKYVYVGVFGVQGMVTYERNSDNSLTEIERTPLSTTVDNIQVDSTGDLWLGCHYVMVQLAEYAGDPLNNGTPSQVLRVRTSLGHVTGVQEVLMDDGKLFSGSSVAIYRQNKMLVGSIHTKAMICDIKYL